MPRIDPGSIEQHMIRFLKVLLKLIGGLAAILLMLVVVIFWQLRTITDIDDYPDLLGNWAPASVAHFPEQVPAEADLRKVSYFPGFLQGGSHLQLRVRLPEPRVYAVQAQADLLAIMVFRGRELTNPRTADAVLQELPPAPFHTADGGMEESFPPDYTVYVLAAEHGETQGFPWNHGRARGVAVSREKSELVYWVERW